MKTLLTITFLLVSLNAWGATYYVDFDTGDNSDDGLSLANAWKEAPGSTSPTDTPTDGWVQIAVGDELIFTAGQTWTQQIRIRSNNYDTPTQESERITLKSSTTTRAIFDMTTSGQTYAFSPELPYISLEYFEVRNVSGTGTRRGIRNLAGTAEYLKIKYCYIHDIISTDSQESYGVTIASDNSEISYSIIKNAEKKLLTIAGPTDDTIIHHNLIYQESGFSGDGLDHGVVITGTGNSFYNNILWTNQTTTANVSYAIKLDGESDGSDNDNNKVYNNLILGWSAGIAIMDTLNGGNVVAHNTIYLKNFAAPTSQSAYALNGIALRGDQSAYAKNNIIRNNIIYYVKESTSSSSTIGMFVDHPSADVSDNTITNNLIYQDGVTDVEFRKGKTSETYHTLAQMEGSGTWNGENGNVFENNSIAAPVFRGGTHTVTNLPTDFDSSWFPNDTGLEIVSGSNAVDQGFTLGSTYNTDIKGTTRPQGLAWDMGAYEVSIPGITGVTLEGVTIQ